MQDRNSGASSKFGSGQKRARASQPCREEGSRTLEASPCSRPQSARGGTRDRETSFFISESLQKRHPGRHDPLDLGTQASRARGAAPGSSTPGVPLPQVPRRGAARRLAAQRRAGNSPRLRFCEGGGGGGQIQAPGSRGRGAPCAQTSPMQLPVPQPQIRETILQNVQSLDRTPKHSKMLFVVALHTKPMILQGCQKEADDLRRPDSFQ